LLDARLTEVLDAGSRGLLEAGRSGDVARLVIARGALRLPFRDEEGDRLLDALWSPTGEHHERIAKEDLWPSLLEAFVRLDIDVEDEHVLGLAVKAEASPDDAHRFFERLVQFGDRSGADPIDRALAESPTLGPRTRAHAIDFEGHDPALDGEEVLALARRAVALSPRSPGRCLFLEHSLYNMNRFDEAAAEVERLRGLVADLPALRIVYTSYADNDVDRLRRARGR
jgi:hypothetical protein